MGRMDRYYKNDSSSSTKRTVRNQSLYRSIYDDNEYSNIEGIATIEKSNEVDIEKIKNMLKNREEFNKQKELRSFIQREPNITKYETFERDENRNYDLKDVLDQAKNNKEKEKYQSLKDFNFDFLNELKNQKVNSKMENKDIVDTNTSKLQKLSDHELGLNMFEDLKSNDNTIIEGKESIRSILEEAKKTDHKKLENTTSNLDKSFFTSSMNFTDDDFEQIAELNKQIQKNSVTLKILIIVISIAVAVGIIVLVFNLLK